MSRPSQASLTTVSPITKARITPPEGMPTDQATVWQKTVDAKPVDWFGEDSAPVLAEYCRTTVYCAALSVMVEAGFKSGDMDELKLAIELHDKESRRLTMLATKLRLTQQSRYTPQAAATASKKAGESRPWDKVG